MQSLGIMILKLMSLFWGNSTTIRLNFYMHKIIANCWAFWNGVVILYWLPSLLAFKGKGEFGHARTPGRYSRFQVTGMIEGLFGFEIFDSEIFWSEILVFFRIAWFKYGFWGVFKTIWRFLVVLVYPGCQVLWLKYNHTFLKNSISRVVFFWQILRLVNLAWDFWVG